MDPPRSPRCQEPIGNSSRSTGHVLRLGGAAGDVDSGYIRRAQHLEALFQDVTRHNFGAVGSGVDVAMAARLIALLADVYLEDVDTGGTERVETRLRERCFEGSRERHRRERSSLFRARRQRCILLRKCG